MKHNHTWYYIKSTFETLAFQERHLIKKENKAVCFRQKLQMLTLELYDHTGMIQEQSYL